MSKNPKKEKSPQERITSKVAAIAASKYFREIANYQGELMIEEAEFDDIENCWTITLGYIESDFASAILGKAGAKVYKVFKVNAMNGEVISMKIRKL